ncbi:alanine aminotransferase 2-like [Arctopsyche grandis]|uniref:alanine aminotransferase 2-like n=1 Tax=Arctopsyche grandis TaxID=121162 RepID=UPI00406D9D47
MDYFIRGPLILRTRQIQDEINKGIPKPFNQIIKMNIGDAHAMGQIPITFIRQILASVMYPSLLDSMEFPDDVKMRTREILKACSGSSVGAYSDSAGIEIIRKHVADYIERRDGVSANWKNIYLTGGASNGIRSILRLFINFEAKKKPGILFPLPQYPIYPVSIDDYNMEKLGYYLDESQNWSLNINELDHFVQESKKSCDPKALVVINPGNPTGQVISIDNIKEIIKFAYKEQLFILADEVYQDNIYPDGMEFHSFKKVLHEMGPPYTSMKMASFMSCSKGYMGECGLRGGYIEVLNITPEMEAKLSRNISSTLCPTVIGQIGIYCIANPPRKGEASYELYVNEKSKIIENLKIKAKMTSEAFNKFEGFTCNEVQGSMYAFPRIHLPLKAIEAAKECGQPPDEFYAFKLLERTGICVIPGKAFGQQDGTYHFRSTILPSIDLIQKMINLLEDFNTEFFQEYK